MYNPSAFALSSQREILAALRRIAFGHLVTVDPNGPLTSTPLPFVIDDDLTTLRAHFARANPHWGELDGTKLDGTELDGTEALMIVAGPDAYVSPRWYPSKAEHGKVVPTWNYEVIHLRGTVSIHHDAAWKLALVSDLTDVQEAAVDDPDRSETWAVSDAPDEFIEGQLRAIVGVSITISQVEAKQKLSQNKPPADRSGAIEGMTRSRDSNRRSTANLMGETETRER